MKYSIGLQSTGDLRDLRWRPKPSGVRYRTHWNLFFLKFGFHRLTCNWHISWCIDTMVSEYTIEKQLPICREVLWRAITSDGRAFMDHLVADGALNRVDSSPIVQIDGGTETEKTRQQVYVPKTIDIPAAVKPVFDDTYLEINDTQHWDEEKPYELNFSIATAALGDYITMSGTTTLTECTDDPRSCLQTIRGKCTVDIAFLGWYIEQAICANMDTFYETYPTHINSFVSKLIDKFDGDPDDLLPALNRMERAVAEQKGADTDAINNVSEGSTLPNNAELNVPGKSSAVLSQPPLANSGPNGLTTTLNSTNKDIRPPSAELNSSTSTS